MIELCIVMVRYARGHEFCGNMSRGAYTLHRLPSKYKGPCLKTKHPDDRHIRHVHCGNRAHYGGG
jgi:hypothetical protein